MKGGRLRRLYPVSTYPSLGPYRVNLTVVALLTLHAVTAQVAIAAACVTGLTAALATSLAATEATAAATTKRTTATAVAVVAVATLGAVACDVADLAALQESESMDLAENAREEWHTL